MVSSTSPSRIRSSTPSPKADAFTPFNLAPEMHLSPPIDIENTEGLFRMNDKKVATNSGRSGTKRINCAKPFDDLILIWLVDSTKKCQYRR